MRGGRGRGYGGMSSGPNRPRNPQNNIPRQLQPQQTHSGPVTDHLQGLKDIDMELELLKRKREIIEQQQQILSNSYRQRNDFEQPMFNQARENRYDDYTSLYDNPRESEFGRGGRDGRNESRGGRSDSRGGRNNSRGGRDEGSRKRPHIPVWENEMPAPPPKRFSAPAPAPTRGAKKPSGSRFSSAPNRPRFEPQRPQPQPLFPELKATRRPPQKKKEFYPTKVSKPTAAPPVKLATYQPAERKKLVAAAVASTADVDDSLLLRADREPSHLMVGRLELTLGAIIKDIKNANPDHESLFKSPGAMRAMKQCVRNRIRTAMIGKVVANTDIIKAAYYDMFPFGNDEDVIMQGVMAQQNKNFIAVDTANPEMYFKKNMRNLMILKMEEMTDKLQQIYCGGKAQGRYKVHVHRFRPPRRYQPKRESENEIQGDAESKPNETQTKEHFETANEKVNEAETVENQPIVENDAVVENNETIEPVQEEANTNESTVANTNESIIENQTEDENQTKVETQSNAETQTEADNQPNPEKESKDVVEPAPTDKSTFVVPNELINNEHYKALDNLLTYKMLHLLKRFTPEFVKIMDVDALYRRTKAAIIAETAKKMKKPLTSAQVSEAIQATTDSQNVSVKNSPDKLRSPMHYVKILGKPSLPKRKAMESFFSQFKPKSIKKHKSVHNLLFVGFLDKESYDNILAADGTTIGRFTLDIKVSERNDPNKGRNNTQAPVKPETDKSNESKDILIGADIDEQITDLLTSINNTDSEDVVMAEPPVTEVKENGEQVKIEEVVGSGADQNANNVANDNDDVEFNDPPQNDVIEIQDEQENDDVVEIKDVQNDAVEDREPGNGEAETKDAVEELKTDGKDVKGTPTRASARLATGAPGGIRTRRMSKLPE